MTSPSADLRATCKYFLSGHLPRTQREWLEYLAASPMADLSSDRYGDGPAIALLEQEVATLLGKEAAIFVHKGVIAQLMALRVWTERAGKRTVALHPKSHIDLDERKGYEQVLQLRGLRTGKDHSPFTLQELKDLHEPCGAIVVELPLRRAGFKLPSWEELVAISTWAREQSVPLHFDGARLWESAPFYGRSYAEIAALADSIYVSFYKGLGGLAGCVLAGSRDFIEEARIWGDRLSGSLYTAFPYVVAAYEGLHRHVPKMAGYVARAQELGGALRELPGVMIVPDPPQTNSFQIHLPATRQALQKGVEYLAETEGVWLFNGLVETTFPALTMAEIAIGEAAEQWSIEEAVAWVKTLLHYAQTNE
ncbi:MAG TPA: beta-eliminating lyase-related protein [Ktedonobacteraceae bacterium]|nr:beta-eliminating lyase-related protein [Ktedonobacteraceae bacterium]